MLKSLTARLVASVCLLLISIGASAQSVHFVGFNSLHLENKDAHKTAFQGYIKQLKPIMARYGVTTDVYEVVFGGDGEVKADYVTFGSAKDQASFQAFFQDAEFHSIFPTLVGALREHQVVFTEDEFAPDNKSIPGHTLLVMNWLKGDKEAALKKVHGFMERLEPVNKKYGARSVAFGSGVYSNKGLAANVTDTVPPQFVEIWSIEDAHGLFDDPEAKAVFQEAENLVDHSESYWLKELKTP